MLPSLHAGFRLQPVSYVPKHAVGCLLLAARPSIGKVFEPFSLRSVKSHRQRCLTVVPKADTSGNGTPSQSEKQDIPFGYTRKDVIIIGVGLIALGYAAYYGLQAAGLEPGLAGNFVQLAIFLGICVFWVSSYLFRVATKEMTYVKQLDQYEEAVMRKRLEEMPGEEVERLLADVDTEREARQKRREEWLAQQKDKPQ